MLAGMPATVAGTTVNRFCSSGLQAIALAAHQIQNEGVDAAIGGGVESISVIPRDSSPNPVLQEKMPGLYMVMGDTAEVVAKRYNVSRLAQDEYSLLSQQRTARAQKEGFFEGEIAPLRVTKAILDKKTGEHIGKEEVCADKDECNRPDTTLEGLLALKPHFDQTSGQGSVTAGNASQLSDGASATLLLSRERADRLGIPYKLLFRGFAVAGCEPDEMGIGPVFAVPKLLKRHGLKVDDIDLWELNEAFAVQQVYCRDRRGRQQNSIDIDERIEQSLARLERPSLRRVINATGVVLHTNLGRAPLPRFEPLVGYSNLEYDLGEGRRGKRDVHVAGLLERLVGAPGIAVNNNAAAIYLALNELAAGYEVIVSRGELIEIGYGFRIPDIMQRSGAVLREVGTTNRTRIEDYREAINERTRLLLRVHPSNFRIQGFTAKPKLSELAALATHRGIPLYEDLGSGCVADLRRFGIDEP